MRTVILSATPLSAAYADELRRRLGGDLEFTVLSRVRSLPALGLVRELRRLSRSCLYIAFEDVTSYALAPLLEIFALATFPARLAFLDESFTTIQVRLGHVISGLGALGRASLATALAARSAMRELTTLERGAPRTGVRAAGSRVLYLNTNLWFGLKAGGSVAHIVGIVNALVRAGRDVELASLNRPELVSSRVEYRPIKLPGVLGLPAELNQYVVQRAVVKDIIERGTSYEFIYQRLSVHSYAGAALSQHLGVPLVIEYNGSEVWIARNWGRPLRYETLALRSEAELLRRAALVVTVSDVLADELLGRGIERERILSHPNGFDPELADPSRYTPSGTAELLARLGIAEGSIVVIFVGTFGRWHGTEVLAQSIREMVRSDAAWLDRKRVRFVFVGDGLRMPEVRQILRGAPEAYVTLTGLVPQSEAPAYLAAADIAVSPHVSNEDSSEFFGSPTKLFEYMGMGKAIVASDLAQIGRVIRPALDVRDLPENDPALADGNVGLVVRPGLVGDLIAGIRFLVERPAWRSSLGQRARLIALERYTWDRQIEHILDRLGGPGLG